MAAMSGFDQLFHDIKQGYNVIDLLPEEDSALFTRLSKDVKEGYCVVDLLEEEELGGGVGPEAGGLGHLGSFSSVQGHPSGSVTQEVMPGAGRHLGSFSSVQGRPSGRFTQEVTLLLSDSSAGL